MNLLDLPPELIAQIWSHIPQNNNTAMRPVCRALLPLTRRALLRRVRLPNVKRMHTFSQLIHPTSRRQATALRATTRSDRPLALNVRELSLPNLTYEPNEEGDDPDCKAVHRILSSTFEVEHLTIEGSGLLKLILPSKKCAFRFLKVQTLNLDYLDPFHTRFYDMKRLGRLRFWRSLRALQITLDRDWEEEVDEEYIAHPHRAYPLPHIRTLHLGAGASLSTSSAANFISHFTNLTSLTLELTDLAQLSPFLEAAPTTLTSLSVSFDLDVDWQLGEEGIILDPVLERFVNLTSLTLGERTYSSTSSASFPILSASYAISTLTLSLDAFCAYVSLIPSEHPDRPNVAAGSFRIDESWSLPRWTINFSYENAKEIVRVAEEVGIRLSGTLLEAIEVEELKVREEKYLQDRADDILLSLVELFSQS